MNLDERLRNLQERNLASLYQGVVQKIVPRLFEGEEEQRRLFTISGVLNYFSQYLL